MGFARGTSGGAAAGPPYTTLRYFDDEHFGSTGTTTIPNGVAFIRPWWCRVSTLFSVANIQIPSGAGAPGTTIALGLYELRDTSTTIYKLNDFGTVAGDTTGNKPFTVNTVIPAGWWLPVLLAVGGTPTLNFCISGTMSWITGNENPDTNFGAAAYISSESGLTSLPSTLTIGNAQARYPIIKWRAT